MKSPNPSDCGVNTNAKKIKIQPKRKIVFKSREVFNLKLVIALITTLSSFLTELIGDLHLEPVFGEIPLFLLSISLSTI